MADPKYLRPGLPFAIAHASEEAGETITELAQLVAALGKMQRWGQDSYDPTKIPGYRETNIDWVRRQMIAARREFRDLEDAIERMELAALAEREAGSAQVVDGDSTDAS